MDIKYLKITDSRLEEFTHSAPDAIESQDPLWISIFTEDRNEIAEQLGGVIHDELAIEHVLEPGNSTRIRFTDRWAVLDFNTVVKAVPVDTEYITFLVKEDLLITIVDKARASMEEIISQMNSLPLPADEGLMHVVYLIFHELSSENLDAVANARKRVDKLAEIIDERPKDVEPSNIMSIKRDLVVIFGVLEDEYYSIGFLPKLRFQTGTAKYREHFAETARGLEHLKKSVERTEDRLESIHLQYMLSLQDLTNKRLSTLTILQAIFVPLTLIAGIYGMNFAFIPELKWDYGYFWIMGLMVVIVVCELWYFYKHDWFK